MSRRPGIGSNYLDTHTEWHVKGNRPYTQVNGIIARLPRFYKDKLFTKRELEHLAADGIMDADDAYREELNELSAHHDDPMLYYDERANYAHDMVRSKINSNDLF